MKQKRKIIISGALLLLIFVFGLWYLMGDSEESPDEDSVWVCQDGLEGMTAISIDNNKDNETLSFSNNEESWSGSDGSEYENSQFAPYIAALGYMKAEEKLEVSGEEKQNYGLADPDYTINVQYDDGKEFHYDLGKYVDNLGLYISEGDKEEIYLIDIRRGSIMEDMIASLYDVALTNVKFDEIRGISLYTPDKGQISLNRSEAPRADGDFYWNIFKPFAWTADTKKVTALIDTVEEIGTLKRTDEKMSAEKCGLEGEDDELPQVAFYDTYDSEMTLYLGDECGEYVYCKTNYLEDIYLIDRSILALVDLEADTLVDTSLYHYEIPSVEQCSISFQDKTYELSAKWVANEDGKKGQRYFLDGENITGADYASIVDWFEETRIEKVETKQEAQGSILGTITINRLSPPYEQTMTFRSVKGDESLVRVDLGGTAAAYIEKNTVENFIDSIGQ